MDAIDAMIASTAIPQGSLIPINRTILKVRDLCKIPFPPNSRNPNTGFRLFLFHISTDSTQILP